MNTKPYTFDRVVRMLIGFSGLVLVFLLVNRLSGVLLPFLIAWLLAYLLQPIVHFFQIKLRFKNRLLSVITTLLLFFGILFLVIWLLTPLVSNEVQKASQLIVVFTQNMDVNSILPVAWQNEIRQFLSQLNFQKVLQDENFMSVVKKLAPQLWNILNSSLNFILGLTVVLIVFLYLIFILLDYDKLTKGMVEIIPVKYKTLVVKIVSDVEVGMNRYFRGQSLIALIVGILSAIGFSIIQLPLAIVAGLLVGVLTLVPYLKAVGLIPCAVLGLLQSAETGQSYLSVLLGIAIVFAAVQMFEDLFLVPKIMGKVTGMNPALILLSLSIWGSLMGMVGMIIALPITTLIISYYKRLVLNETKPEDVVSEAKLTDKEQTEIEI